MTQWAARFAATDQNWLAELRCHLRLQCAIAGDSVWITGSDDDLRRKVRYAIPAAEHFDVLPDNRLRPINRRVPVGVLPEVEWRPVSDVVNVELPFAVLAGRAQEQVELRLIPSEVVCEPAALLATLPVWTSYATGAPEVRLQHWRFAVCSDGRVLIAGVPLPPIPGERLVLDGGIAVSAGRTWCPPVEATVLADLLELEADDVALLRTEGTSHRITIERISGDEFVAASRSAARASAKEVSDAINR